MNSKTLHDTLGTAGHSAHRSYTAERQAYLGGVVSSCVGVDAVELQVDQDGHELLDREAHLVYGACPEATVLVDCSEVCVQICSVVVSACWHRMVLERYA
jgi:hypothetical protein